MKKLIAFTIVASLSLQNIAFAELNRTDQAAAIASGKAQLEISNLKAQLKNLDSELLGLKKSISENSTGKYARITSMTTAWVGVLGTVIGLGFVASKDGSGIVNVVIGAIGTMFSALSGISAVTSSAQNFQADAIDKVASARINSDIEKSKDLLNAAAEMSEGPLKSLLLSGKSEMDNLSLNLNLYQRSRGKEQLIGTAIGTINLATTLATFATLTSRSGGEKALFTGLATNAMLDLLTALRSSSDDNTAVIKAIDDTRKAIYITSSGL